MTENERYLREKLGNYLASLSDEEAGRIEIILSVILAAETSFGKNWTQDIIDILIKQRQEKLKQ